MQPKGQLGAGTFTELYTLLYIYIIHKKIIKRTLTINEIFENYQE